MSASKSGKGNHRRGFARAENLRKRVERGTDKFRSVGHKHLPKPNEADDDTSLYVWPPNYLADLGARNYSERTIERRQQALRRFLWWTQERGVEAATEVTLPVLESYQRWLWRYRKGNDKPLGVGTQRGELAAVKDYFKWLVRNRILVANPASELQMPRGETRLPPDALTGEQIATLLAVPDTSDPLGVRDRAILELFYSTGLRRSEVARIRIEDINHERATLRVWGKGNKERVVPVGQRALQWITKYLDEVRQRLVIDQAVTELFLTGLGRGFPPQGLGQTISRLMRAAGIERGGPHLLRHSCATHMHEGGADMRHIQRLLGHEKLETTSLYAQVSIEHLREVHSRCHPAENVRKPDANEQC